MLWIVIPHRVEEDIVLKNICHKYRGSVLGFTPPWSESVETFIVLALEVLMLTLSISNLISTL
jgi:hypothetical protein